MITGYKVWKKEETLGKGAIDTASSALSFAGPCIVVPLAQAGIEHQWKNEGGWAQFFRDAGNGWGDNWFGRMLQSTGDWYANYK